MNPDALSPLQQDAISLGLELMDFLIANPYIPDPKAQEEASDLELIYMSSAGHMFPSGYDNRPKVRVFLDNREWAEKLRQSFNTDFAEKIEAVRLRLVEAGAVPEDERWLAPYPSDIRINVIAGYLVAAAFRFNGLRLVPHPGSVQELIKRQFCQ